MIQQRVVTTLVIVNPKGYYKPGYKEVITNLWYAIENENVWGQVSDRPLTENLVTKETIH